MSIFGELFVSGFFGIFLGAAIGWGYYFLKSQEGQTQEEESSGGEKACQGGQRFLVIQWVVSACCRLRRSGVCALGTLRSPVAAAS